MTLRKTLLGSTMVLGLAAMPVTPVLAQTMEEDGSTTSESAAPEQSGSETMQAPETETAADYTDSELETFVAAALEVSNVRREYTPRIQQADSEADQQALAEEAQAEMISAIEAVEGIDLETFNEIGQAAQQNEDLSARIVEMARAQQPAQQDGSNDG